MLALGLVIPAAAQNIQITHGACSPAIQNVTGNISIVCEGVGEEALKEINRLIEAQYRNLTDRLRETEKLVKDFKILSARLDQITNPVDQEKRAASLIKQGRLTEAGRSLDEILSSENEQLLKLARTNFNRAEIYALQFYPLKALPHYRKALKFDPGNLEYTVKLAEALLHQRELAEARQLFNQVLEQTSDAESSRDLAGMLMRAKSWQGIAFAIRTSTEPDSSGEAIPRQVRMLEASKHQEQAVAMYRRIDKLAPGTHTAELAEAINVLAGDVYMRDNYKTTNSTALHIEAADLYERLAREHPKKETYYLAYAMGAMYSLAINQKMTLGEDDNARQTTDRVIYLYERIRTASKEYLTPELAASHLMIGSTYLFQGQLDKAEEATATAIEVLEASTRLGDEHYSVLPQFYLLQSVLLEGRNNNEPALDSVQKAIRITRQLVKRSPRQFGPLLLGLLGEQAKLQKKMKLYDAARTSVAERERLAKQLGLD